MVWNIPVGYLRLFSDNVMVVEMATDKGNKKLDVDLRYACPLTSEVKSEGRLSYNEV